MLNIDEEAGKQGRQSIPFVDEPGSPRSVMRMQRDAFVNGCEARFLVRHRRAVSVRSIRSGDTH